MLNRRSVQGLVTAALLLGAALGTLALTTTAFGGGRAPRAPAGAPAPPTGSELAAIQQLVLNAAASGGEASPTDAFLVPSTRPVAEQVDAGSGLGYADTP